MSELTHPPITVIKNDTVTKNSSNQVLVILRELETMLNQLIINGEANSVDIHSVPLAKIDYYRLKKILGEGDVHASFNDSGQTSVVETSIPGIWWVTQRNTNNSIVAEFIEVTTMPSILQPPADDIQESIDILRSLINKVLTDSSADQP